MEDLLNKHKSIKDIVYAISHKFGPEYFVLSDFWDSDNYAVGLRKNEKLIYISTWKFRKQPVENLSCYVEFELINPITLETIKVERILDNINKDRLIYEIKNFVE